MRRVTAPGLALFVLIACWGPFLAGDLASEWVFGWISGYLLLLFVTAYEFIFSRAPIHPLPFRLVVLGVVFMNFIMQLTGGVHSSLWPSYYLFTVVVAALSRLPQALLTVLLVVAVEAANLLIAGQFEPSRWSAYAGFVLSLAGVAAATSVIVGRLIRKAEQEREKHEQLIADADALDPLADSGKLKKLISRHLKYTGSPRAKHILDNWDTCVHSFVKVFPMEYRRALGRMNKVDEATEREGIPND